MKEINIKDVDLKNAYFHFTNRDNLESIEIDGLKAQIGDASKMVGDKPRVCMSKGGKGILGAKNAFIRKFTESRICDIPEGYRKYFNISDFTSTEQVKPEDVYSAMEKRFKDEIYLQIDATEGEDFLENEVHGLTAQYDIKGKENHDIDPEKLSLITAEEGSNSFDIIKYLYNRLLENATRNGKENVVKDTLSDLNSMFEYIQQRDSKQSNTEIKVPEGELASQNPYIQRLTNGLDERFDDIVADKANKLDKDIIKSEMIAMADGFNSECHLLLLEGNITQEESDFLIDKLAIAFDEALQTYELGDLTDKEKSQLRTSINNTDKKLQQGYTLQQIRGMSVDMANIKRDMYRTEANSEGQEEVRDSLLSDITVPEGQFDGANEFIDQIINKGIELGMTDEEIKNSARELLDLDKEFTTDKSQEEVSRDD